MVEKTVNNDDWYLWLVHHRWISSKIARKYSSAGAAGESWKLVLQEYCSKSCERRHPMSNRTFLLRHRLPQLDTVVLRDFASYVDSDEKLQQLLIEPVHGKVAINQCQCDFYSDGVDRIAHRFFIDPLLANRRWKLVSFSGRSYRRLQNDQCVVSLVNLLLAQASHVRSLRFNSVRFDFNEMCTLLSNQHQSRRVTHVSVERLAESGVSPRLQIDLGLLPWQALRTLRLLRCSLFKSAGNFDRLVAGLAACGGSNSLRSLSLYEPDDSQLRHCELKTWIYFFNLLPNLKRLWLGPERDSALFDKVLNAWLQSTGTFFVFDVALLNPALARVLQTLCAACSRRQKRLTGIRLKGLNRTSTCTPLTAEHTKLFHQLLTTSPNLTTVSLSAFGFPGHQEKIDGWASIFQSLSALPSLSLLAISYCAEFIDEAADSLCIYLSGAAQSLRTFVWLNNYVNDKPLAQIIQSIPESVDHVLMNFNNFHDNYYHNNGVFCSRFTADVIYEQALRHRLGQGYVFSQLPDDSTDPHDRRNYIKKGKFIDDSETWAAPYKDDW